MAQRRDNNRGMLTLVGAASIASLIATLTAPRPVKAAEEPEVIVVLDEEVKQALAVIIQQQQRLIEIGEQYTGISADPRTLALLKAQFLSQPDAVLSLINSHQPNLVRALSLSINIALAPGAVTTITSAITPGFISVFTGLDVFVDIPFAIDAIATLDGQLWLADTGVCPISYRYIVWWPVKSQWQATFTNISAVDANLHIYIESWEVEAKTFNRIMSAIKPLSDALAEYGSPEGGS